MDGKSAYVQIFLAGDQGTSTSHASVAAVRDIVASVPAPPGIQAHVAGNTVLNADAQVAEHQSMATMELVSVGVIIVHAAGSSTAPSVDDARGRWSSSAWNSLPHRASPPVRAT